MVRSYIQHGNLEITLHCHVTRTRSWGRQEKKWLDKNKIKKDLQTQNIQLKDAVVTWKDRTAWWWLTSTSASSQGWWLKEKLEEEECKHITLTIGHTNITVSNFSLIKIIV